MLLTDLMLDLIKMDILLNLNLFFIENTVDQLASSEVFHTNESTSLQLHAMLQVSWIKLNRRSVVFKNIQHDNC